MQVERIIRIEEVKALVGLGRTSIFLMEKDGRFPQRVSIGLRAVGWSLQEVLRWVEERKALRTS